MIIRPEDEGDIDVIGQITNAAFGDGSQTGDTVEAVIVENLRAGDDLVVSLVAELDGRVIGHVAFSPVRLTDYPTGWLGLGPISIEPDFQRQGYGSALVRTGLAAIQARGAEGCVLLGDPGFYKRFGFQSGGITYQTAPVDHVMWRSFTGIEPTGEVHYCDSFNQALAAEHS